MHLTQSTLKTLLVFSKLNPLVCCVTPISFSDSSPFLPYNRNAAVTVIQMVSRVLSLKTPFTV